MSTLFLLTLAAAALVLVAFVEVAHGDGPHKHTNRLIHETSPYLLQHAHNPVDWYPWGPEAFEKAKRENKPVFLSVGYSTCHWCHVMAHESFEAEDVAEILNEHFVAIKVDREERPDVDEQYMMATQLFTRRGGWPNSVWLTPDGRPWFAGTYFPREDRGGTAGFKTVLRELASAWRDRRDDVEKQADAFADAIRQTGAAAGGGEPRPIDDGLVTKGIHYFVQNYDEDQGGFGSAPKFPPHGALAMMLHRQRVAPDLQLSGVIGHTLDAMAAGGIYDHLGGGFARYATDSRWFLPHFEKMLYDNAQLITAYSRAYKLLGHARGHYRDVVSHTFNWLEREMIDPAGGFYSALDADSEGEEGKFYVWTLKELEDVLGEADAKLFAKVYGATEDGNFVEEATRHRTGANVLSLHEPLAESAKQLGLDEAQFRGRLEQMRAKLLERRATRSRPHLDDKVLSGWNGLMIAALAEAGRVFKDDRYTAAAAKAADFVLVEMRADGKLLRSWRKGEAKLPGYLDDYAYLIAGLLELHETTKQPRWLDESRRLADQMMTLFYDAGTGGFFNTSEQHETLLLRAKELGGGGNIPSGNGVAAQVLTRLALLTSDATDRGYGDKAAATLSHFSGAMGSNPHGNEALILAAAVYLEHAGNLPPLNQPPHKSDADAIAAKPPVTVEAYAQHTTVHPGQEVRVAIRITIDKPYHIYGPELGEHKLIPTSVALDEGPATLGDISYPAPRQVNDPVINEPIAMYEGQVTLIVPVHISADAAAGPTQLVVTVNAQACDDRSCLAPQNYRLALPIAIAPAPKSATGTSLEPRHPDLFKGR